MHAPKAVVRARSHEGLRGHTRIHEAGGDPTGEGAGGGVGPYRPITDPWHLEALRESARRLSPRHWALVVILTRTGIEIEGLCKLTWRDVYPDRFYWKPSKSPQAVSVPVDDEELAYALRVFVTGQRKASGMLDYWIRQIREGTGIVELRAVTGYSLRLTHCLALLGNGVDPEEIARDLRLPRPAVHDVIALMDSTGMAKDGGHQAGSLE